MSRRLRKEIEASKQIKQEQEEEPNIYEVRRQRIYAPVVWQTLPSGIIICDLKEDKYQQAIELLKEFYLPGEDLSRNVDLMEDEVSVEFSLQRLLYIMKDSTSLIAITNDPKDPKIVGILVIKVIRRTDYARIFSRVQLIDGEPLKKCNEVKAFLNRKTDIFEPFQCDQFLRYYAVCVLPEYRHKGLGLAMMRCGVDVARSMNVPVIMGIFTNFRIQKLAKRLGMEPLKEINYVDWRDKNCELIFSDPGPGNYTIALMAGYTPPAPPKPRRIPSEIIRMEEEEAKVKRTRKEKRHLLVKHGKFRKKDFTCR